MHLPFVKMEGCGNDYVYLYADTPGAVPRVNFSRLAREVSHRVTAVGSDGLILVEGGEDPCRMRMWNADGSEGLLCVNGVRCAALLAVREDADKPLDFTMETAAGPVAVRVASRNAQADVRVALPAPRVTGESTHALRGETMRGVHVDAGNPHCVFWMPSAEALEAAPLERWGVNVQMDRDRFPQGVNVHLAWRHEERIVVRHYERGSGSTLACGSGALAVWAADCRARGAYTPRQVVMPGGAVHVAGNEEQAVLTGPARECFRGVWPLASGA